MLCDRSDVDFLILHVLQQIRLIPRIKFLLFDLKLWCMSSEQPQEQYLRLISVENLAVQQRDVPGPQVRRGWHRQ